MGTDRRNATVPSSRAAPTESPSSKRVRPQPVRKGWGHGALNAPRRAGTQLSKPKNPARARTASWGKVSLIAIPGLHDDLRAKNHIRRIARIRRSRCADLLPRSQMQPSHRGQRRPDHVRLSDIEPGFVCTACGKRGADVRPVHSRAHMGTG